MLRHQEEWRTQAFESQINEYPADVQEEYLRLSDWVRKLSEAYQDKILIRIIDAYSLMGLVKAIWYRFRRYPTFIVNRRIKYTGWDEARLAEILEGQLIAAP
jgi:hypothetical protein